MEGSLALSCKGGRKGGREEGISRGYGISSQVIAEVR